MATPSLLAIARDGAGTAHPGASDLVHVGKGPDSGFGRSHSVAAPFTALTETATPETAAPTSPAIPEPLRGVVATVRIRG
jgi:hypothetical protein